MDEQKEEKYQMYIETLEQEVQDLTKALTGLTCNGSEFFVRRHDFYGGSRYVADIYACVEYIRRSRENLFNTMKDAIIERNELREKLK